MPDLVKNISGCDTHVMSLSYLGRRCPNFTQEETKTLLEIWSDDVIQTQFKISRQHISIWKEIATKLFNAGKSSGKQWTFPKRGYIEVLNRVKYLKKIYSAIKSDTLEKDEFPHCEIFEKTFEKHQLQNSTGTTDRRIKSKPCAKFTHEETKSMLGICNSEEFQSQLKNSRRHGLLWNVIASQLFESGKQNPAGLQFPKRGGSEIQKRFVKLKRDYIGLQNYSYINPDDYPYYEYFKNNLECDNKTDDESNVAITDDNTRSKKEVTTNETVLENQIQVSIRKSPRKLKHCTVQSSKEDGVRKSTDDASDCEEDDAKVSDDSEYSPTKDKNRNDKNKNLNASLEKYLPRRGKHCRNFTEVETKALLRIWGDGVIQTQLQTCKRNENRQIWNHIASRLFETGKQSGKKPKFPRRDFLELRTRVRNLKRTYTAVESGLSAMKKNEFSYYEIFKKILGGESSQTISNMQQNSDLCTDKESLSNNSTPSHKAWNCQKCLKECKSLVELKSHVLKAHGKTIKCNLCDGLSFSRNSQLIYHCKSIHRGVDKPFICTLCGKAFKTLKRLRDHEEGPVHNKHQKYQCENCGKTFPLKIVLQNHVANVHRGERNFVCELCGDSFTANQSLKYHKMSKHGLQELSPHPVKCDQCGRILSDPWSLRNHIATIHQKVYRFHCKICNVGRRIKSAMDKHMLSAHTNKRPEVCQFCQKAYTDKALLKIHIRTHTGEKPFKCEECGKAFHSSTHMLRHSAVHVTTKTFICEICQKAFATHRYLNSHYRHAHRKDKKPVPVAPKVIVDETTLFQLVANGDFPRTEKALKNSVSEMNK